MPIAGELINILGFKLEGEGNLRKFNKGMDDAEGKSKRTAEGIKRLGIAAGITTAGVVAMGTSAVKQYAQFERTMSRIGVTAGASAEKVRDASDTVRQLAFDFALPIEQAVAGLDTLVASGMSLEQAMAFLPSVLATAQAAGATTEDIANTAIKASSALKIEADRMQAAFDIMVAGGKAGQFELKDMASYIPNLANAFSNLGYTGEEGLQKLIAVLQTLRTGTGEAGAAATAAGEIFGKMFAPEVVKNFDELGVNIKERMEEAKAAGEDLMKAYVRISQETMAANPKATLVDLFSDKQMRDGMLTLMKMGDAWRDFEEAVSSSDVGGSVERDLAVVLDGTQAKIDRLSSSWSTFMNTLGSSLSGPVGGTLDAISGYLSYDQAVAKSNEQDGRPWRLFYGAGEKDQLARRGGYAPTPENKRDRAAAPFAYERLGRMPNRPVTRTPVAAGAGDAVGSQAMIEAGFDNLAARIEGMNSNLATMTSEAGANATITDARQDNRQFPISVSAPVSVTVNEAQAPMAVGNAISGAIGKAATAQQSRIEAEPAQP